MESDALGLVFSLFQAFVTRTLATLQQQLGLRIVKLLVFLLDKRVNNLIFGLFR